MLAMCRFAWYAHAPMKGRVATELQAEQAAHEGRIRAALGDNFTAPAFARWLGRSRNAAAVWIREGRLRAVRFGRTYTVSASDAAAFMATAYLRTATESLRA